MPSAASPAVGVSRVASAVVPGVASVAGVPVPGAASGVEGGIVLKDAHGGLYRLKGGPSISEDVPSDGRGLGAAFKGSCLHFPGDLPRAPVRDDDQRLVMFLVSFHA